MVLLIFRRVFYIICMIYFFAGCASVDTQSNKDKKIQTKNVPFVITKNNNTSQEISFESFINDLANYDIIVLGEQHDSLNQHKEQAVIIESLEQKRQINVVYEMISTDKQEVLNETKKNKTIAKNRLSTALEWDKKWDYNMYKFPIEATFYSDAGLFGGNLSRDEINMFFSQNIAPITGIVSTTAIVKERLKDLIAAAHKTDKNAPENAEMLDILVEIQQYKDRRMADVLVHTSGSDYAKFIESSNINAKSSKNDNLETTQDSKNPTLKQDSKESIESIESKESNPASLLIAGQYHAFKTLGVPLHIIDFNKNKKVIVVILNTKGDEINPKEYDYLLTFESKK